MPRVGTGVFRAVAVTAVQDFFEITPATNKPCRLVRVMLSQYSDVGDAAEELLSYSIFRVPATATGGSGGSAPTVRLVDATGSVGFTIEANNTTVATTSGTLEELLSASFNIRQGLDLPFEPEGRFQVVNGTLLVVRLNVAPGDSLTMNGVVWVEEEG